MEIDGISPGLNFTLIHSRERVLKFSASSTWGFWEMGRRGEKRFDAARSAESGAVEKSLS
jgi:hypothetical protein